MGLGTACKALRRQPRDLRLRLTEGKNALGLGRRENLRPIGAKDLKHNTDNNATRPDADKDVSLWQ